MTPTQILQVAETPQFFPTTPHAELAFSVLRPPMNDWQRPLSEARVSEIASVFRNNELMPNPVLLSENGNLNSRLITISQQRAGNGVPTNIWNVKIDYGTTDKALWILDGQHRIHGLYRSLVQANNEIPVVLLLNDQHVYTGSILAKIFAQVTTNAKKLDNLHHEWLTYAFKLGVYDTARSGSKEHRLAMEAVAELCSRPQFSVGTGTIANVFLNKIRFNEQQPFGAFGFGYDCTDLKQLFYKHYYSRAAISHLTPLTLAGEVCRAVQALQLEVSAPQEATVFFGDAGHAQGVMKDAFLVGVLSKLLTSPAPMDWRVLLQDLQFSTTPWNFAAWTRTLGGQRNVHSREVAYRVFMKVFEVGSLPGGVNLADYLRGNAAEIELTCSGLTAHGRVSSRDAQRLRILRAGVVSATIDERRHLKVTQRSDNIADIRVVDANSRPGRPVTYPAILKRGMVLNANEYSIPLVLEVVMEFYGGTEVASNVALTWTP